MKASYLRLFLLLYVTACQSPKELDEVDKNRIRADVEDLLKENFKLIKKEGFTGELKSLYNSPDFYWVPPRRSMPISYDSVALILNKFTPAYRSISSKWETILVQPLSPEIASYTGKFHSIYIDTAGHVTEFNMMETGVAVKKDGEWKLASGQTSVSPDS